MLVSDKTPEFLSWFSKVKALVNAKIDFTEGAVYMRIRQYLPTGEIADLPLCFVERETGTIYRAVNWRFPSKKFTRGNIFDAANGMDHFTEDGLAKLKAGCPKGFKYDHPRKTPVRQKKSKPEPSYDGLPPLISIPAVSGMVPAVKPVLPVKVTTQASDMSFFSKD